MVAVQFSTAVTTAHHRHKSADGDFSVAEAADQEKATQTAASNGSRYLDDAVVAMVERQQQLCVRLCVCEYEIFVYSQSIIKKKQHYTRECEHLQERKLFNQIFVQYCR